MAYAVEIMTGVLSGGVFLDAMKGMYKYPDDPSLTSHLMMAINIATIMEPDEHEARMAEFTDKIHSSPMWDDDEEMLLPGEIEYRTAQDRKINGIPLPRQLFEDLTALGQELGVEQGLGGKR
jgi:LDH2 family malate/lactate/ureidoglycolate dehydrogenase